MSINHSSSRELREKFALVQGRAKEIIFGQDNLLESLMAALVCEGHLLIEGMPGLGKTLSVNVMSKLCDLSFKRVQFTPDLLPSDLVGTMVYSPQKDEFSTKFGPIFTQILLADEINRSPAKVQSALLECMGERQVTIGDKTHRLAHPFVVLATQNPIEQEGTYPLPEAQMDRFMMKVSVDYPDFEAEKQILDLRQEKIHLSPTFTADDLLTLKKAVAEIYVDEKIKDFIVKTVQATRPGSKYFPSELSAAIVAGAGPRAGIWLYQLAKFKAFLEGQEFVTPENVISVVPDVMGHRIILSYEANLDKMSARGIVLEIAKSMV